VTFPAEKIAAWKRLKARYQNPRAALIPVLHEIQDHVGHLDRASMEWAAAFFDIPPIEVQATATFYWMFRTGPEGKFRIAVCKNISCDLRGKDEVLRAIEEVTGLKADHHPQTSPDGLWTLRLVECMGACSSAPMMDINGEYHEWLDYEKTRTILERLGEREAAR
jgi:NADH:ubiquinone oxidoreductase subunit E